MRREELYPYIQQNQPNICQISVLQNGQEIWSGEWIENVLLPTLRENERIEII